MGESVLPTSELLEQQRAAVVGDCWLVPTASVVIELQGVVHEMRLLMAWPAEGATNGNGIHFPVM